MIFFKNFLMFDLFVIINQQIFYLLLLNMQLKSWFLNQFDLCQLMFFQKMKIQIQELYHSEQGTF